jgi:hypothetical protein
MKTLGYRTRTGLEELLLTSHPRRGLSGAIHVMLQSANAWILGVDGYKPQSIFVAQNHKSRGIEAAGTGLVTHARHSAHSAQPQVRPTCIRGPLVGRCKFGYFAATSLRDAATLSGLPLPVRVALQMCHRSQGACITFFPTAITKRNDGSMWCTGFVVLTTVPRGKHGGLEQTRRGGSSKSTTAVAFPTFHSMEYLSPSMPNSYLVSTDTSRVYGGYQHSEATRKHSDYEVKRSPVHKRRAFLLRNVDPRRIHPEAKDYHPSLEPRRPSSISRNSPKPVPELFSTTKQNRAVSSTF